MRMPKMVSGVLACICKALSDKEERDIRAMMDHNHKVHEIREPLELKQELKQSKVLS